MKLDHTKVSTQIFWDNNPHSQGLSSAQQILYKLLGCLDRLFNFIEDLDIHSNINNSYFQVVRKYAYFASTHRFIFHLVYPAIPYLVGRGTSGRAAGRLGGRTGGRADKRTGGPAIGWSGAWMGGRADGRMVGRTGGQLGFERL